MFNSIGQVLQENKKILSKNTTPSLDAEVLLCFVLKKPKEFLHTYPDYELTQEELDNYSNCIKKRLEGAPIAHITGVKEFYGREFIVTPDTLVPRPETELFIDYIKNYELRITNYESLIIDVGTGTGCIIVSLAKELRKNLRFFATDISEKVLEVARQNAKNHNVDNVINFHQGNLLEPVFNNPKIFKDPKNHNNHIIITANLPYLTPNQIKNSPSIHQEPELALVAGEDGLKYYRELFEQIKRFMIYDLKCKVLLEIDNSQRESISKLIKKEFPEANFEIKKDLAGLSRLVVLTNSKTQAPNTKQ